jgi:muramoyltetrapeptide carboxypeptidase
MLIRPTRLQPGDTIGILAPASAPPDPENIDRSVAVLEKLGFKVKLSPNVRKRLGFLAGSDHERASDLMRLFADRRVNAILCVRGGYGAARLLPLLDYRIIRENAKIFVGYSDITSLHCAFLTKANLISFHGPMLNSDFVHDDMPPFTLQSFLRTLTSLPVRRRESGRRMGERWNGNIAEGYRKKTVKILRRGIAQGRLIGGNLTLLCTTIGTPWQPPFRDGILFLEDLSEQPYRFDRMLTYLLNCGLLQQVAGIAIGINHDCEDPKAKRAKEYRQTLEDVFRERLLSLTVPIVIGLPFGHVPHNATLPVGMRVTLDGNKGELILSEPAVC